jgi:hypothetical protein
MKTTTITITTAAVTATQVTATVQLGTLTMPLHPIRCRLVVTTLASDSHNDAVIYNFGGIKCKAKLRDGDNYLSCSILSHN